MQHLSAIVVVITLGLGLVFFPNAALVWQPLALSQPQSIPCNSLYANNLFFIRQLLSSSQYRLRFLPIRNPFRQAGTSAVDDNGNFDKIGIIVVIIAVIGQFVQAA